MKKQQYPIAATLALEAPLTAPALLRGDPAKTIRRMAGLRFDGVELQIPFPFKSGLLAGLREVCRGVKIPVCAIATGSLYTRKGLSLISDDASIAKEALKQLKEYIDAASMLESMVIIGCVRGNISDFQQYKKYESCLAEALSELLEYARERKVLLTLEAINRYENNYLNTAQECVTFIETYRLQPLGILLDTFHMNIEEVSVTEAIHTAAHYLSHIHAADRTRLVPGTSDLDFAAIAKALEEISYRGWISIEARIQGDEEKEAREGLAYLRSLFNKIQGE